MLVYDNKFISLDKNLVGYDIQPGPGPTLDLYHLTNFDTTESDIPKIGEPWIINSAIVSKIDSISNDGTMPDSYKGTTGAEFNSLRSSGEGENRTYPVPTEPLA